MGVSHSLDLREERQNAVQVHQIDESSPSIRIMRECWGPEDKAPATGFDIMLKLLYQG